MTRMLTVAASWLCLQAAAPLDAQTSARAIGLTLARSVGASSAAHGPRCGSCNLQDVLAPLSMTMLEVELAIPLRTARRSGLEYHARAVPFVIAQGNPTQPAIRAGDGWNLSTATRRASTIGFGVKPAGLRGWVGAGGVRLEADFAAGILHFGTPLLAANATRLNFTYEFGLGVRMSRLGRRGPVIGYRWHHVSNAGLGEVNPGLNSNVIFLGLSVG